MKLLRKKREEEYQKNATVIRNVIKKFTTTIHHDHKPHKKSVLGKREKPVRSKTARKVSFEHSQRDLRTA